MKNILIPTDFNVNSLTCIKDLCRQYEDSRIQLTFIHLFKISDSITDLLMLSRRNKEYDFVSDEFYQACESLKARFPQLVSVKVDFFYGSTLGMFRNYLEAHDIDGVLDLKNCSLQPLNKMSVNPEGLIQRCGLDVIKIKPQAQQAQPAYVAEELLQEAV
jgi:hypothetical protein